MSFGFGGSLSHIVLDDAYNFLKSRNLHGFHRTITPPSLTGFVPSTASLLRSSGYHEVVKSHSIVNLPRIFVLSAADKDGISRLESRYKEYLRELIIAPTRTPEFLESLAYTLSCRRSIHPWRAYAVAHSLKSLIGLQFSEPVLTPPSTELVFVFTGQGAQYAQMGKALLVYEPFRKSLRNSEAYFDELGSYWSLLGASSPISLANSKRLQG